MPRRSPLNLSLNLNLSLTLLAILMLALAGCAAGAGEPPPFIDLSVRQPLPAAAETDMLPLRIAVAAIISPQDTVESYADLAAYLGERLGRPVRLVQRRTYAEVNELIADRQVDLAFVCTSAYIEGQAAFGMELLAAPQIEGELVYYSELIVPAASAAQGMADLRGQVFAFTDPMSFSGRVYPTYLVQQLGAAPNDFFSRTFFTYSHDRAIQAVAAGLAGGAAVDSLVLAYTLRRDPGLHERIRIIHRSPPFGIPPVVVPPDLPPRQKVQLRDLLLGMHAGSEGQAILAALGIDRFVLVADDAYAEVRRLSAAVGSLP